MSASSDFVHLHVHTDYSMLDGAAQIGKLVAEAKRLGQRALAITDHGYLFGAYEFYAAAKAAEIKPIIGLEAYVTPGTSRFDKETRVRWGDESQASDDVSARGAYTHMTLLARTTQGMHNLFRLGSQASLDGQMNKWPRADRDLLERYGNGLIGTTGCPSGEVQTRMRLGQFDEARRCAEELQDIFGKDYFYVELMDHGLDIERRVRTELLDLAKHLGAPLLATNDSHYVTEADQPTQDALLCINSGSRLSDPDRFTFDGTGYYLRPGDEMHRLFADLPEACMNTLRVAEQCEVEFHTVADGASYMPQFPVPEGEDETSWFIKEVERGLNKRFPDGVPEAERRQAEYECDVIERMQFPGYFLVVADYINWAKDQGIRVGPGRGSGAGSMVAYAMGITELNPLKYGLMFERFLNPERVSMPDFDVDFDERRRDEVIDYVTERYGADKVSQVVTYGKIKAKQALKDSARILSKPYSVGEQLTKKMPKAIMGKDMSVSGMFTPSDPRYSEAEEFRRYYAENEAELGPVVNLARELEGLTRQWGVHACAVIMSSHTLTDIIPMMRRVKDGAVITQFDYPTCETLGLLKMDFLGLRNLTVLSDAQDNIVANNKPAVDLESVPLDDQATFDLLSSGETLGVFQLDSSGMRSLLRLMKPTHFNDISAVGALYRPGPMGAQSHTNYALRKNGRQQITPIHPTLEEPLNEILSETYGLIVYQEQVMAIAQKLAGYSLGEADLLRRAMGKKKKAEMDKQFATFKAGMLERNYPEEAITTLWEILVPFSSYAFNKSHSAAYGLVSYWTAYLKANYPAEYMAALLTSTGNNRDKLAMYLRECRRMDIDVLVPDINLSQANFSPVGHSIRFGFSAIRNVGANVVDAIIATRQEKGDFTSFTDFLQKVPQAVCNRRTVESLIKAGVFDSLGMTRRALHARHEEAVSSMVGLKRNEEIGQFDLFGALDEGPADVFTLEIPEMPEWDKKDKLDFERQMLGLYVSDHPLNGLQYVLNRNSDHEVADIITDGGAVPEGARVRLCGLIAGIERKVTKKSGSPMAIITLEDLSGSIEATFFPTQYETFATYLTDDAIVSVVGRVKYTDEGSASLVAQELTVPNVAMGSDGPLVVTMRAERCTRQVAEDLGEILRNHPGGSVVRMRLVSSSSVTTVQLDDALRVNSEASLYSELKALLGRNCLEA
ncbi:DNA polymerase III subunit alpha [Nanchangia anserum]|uniref:DNA polymerase III subunit alpha n=1 Tax=Nanchangia anserum TaxID=2692125 RepID=A0A8I0GHU8_9ACTO|nr:DNA polymerase III subunit alpha [Nanchangia anserum]MBD3690229.1 DNA polymerase III subunit alpha [Nanchangia anserum]